LKHTILPIEKKRDVPSESSTGFAASVSINYDLVTVSDLQFVDESINMKSNEELTKDAIQERERREQEHETDGQSRLQPSVAAKIDQSLVGFNIEICFEYINDDNNSTIAWCDGVVHTISNERNRMVMMKWNAKELD
jgi:hypothetical protein